VLSDGDGNPSFFIRNLNSGNSNDIRIQNNNHAVGNLFSSGSITTGNTASININGAGGDGSVGLVSIVTAAADGTAGYDSTMVFVQAHGQSYNSYSSNLLYTSVNSISFTNPPAGVMVITNNSGKTINYQIRVLNMGSKVITNS
jgi:hypothetical protein